LAITLCEGGFKPFRRPGGVLQPPHAVSCPQGAGVKGKLEKTRTYDIPRRRTPKVSFDMVR
jgi:hypothetical protein